MGHLHRVAMAKGLHKFYRKKNRKYRTFLNGDKKGKRDKAVLIAFGKLQHIYNILETAMNCPEEDHHLKQHIFYEVAYKSGRVKEHNINANFQIQHPNLFQYITFE